MDLKSTNSSSKAVSQTSLLSVCGSTTGTSTSGSIDDIIKMGILKKGDKGLKRFFVLRQDRYASPASIEYYENEKKFRQGHQRKLHLKLKEIFNVNKTIHAKIKHCMAIFTRNDTLYLGCDKEDELDAWFNSIFNVYMGTKKGTPEEISKEIFDHVWDVTIARAQGLKITGAYRLCLNSEAIYLYKTASDEERIDIPLVYISSFGHSSDKLCIRTGRLYQSGAGEIWFHTADPAGAQNIHEVLKNIVDENHANKARSSSAGSDSFRSFSGSVRHSRANSTTNVGTFDRTFSSASTNLLPESRIRAISENEKSLKSWRTHRRMHDDGSEQQGSAASVSPLGPFVGPALSRPASAGQSPSTALPVFSRLNASVHQQGVNFSSGDGVSPTAGPNDLIRPMASENCLISLPVVEESGDVGSSYLPMQPGSSPNSRSIDGYLPMSVSNTRLPHSRQTSWHLEEVRSYIIDTDSDTSSMTAAPLQNRAYSLGSKPQTAGMNDEKRREQMMAVSGDGRGGQNNFGPRRAGLLVDGGTGARIDASDDDRRRAHSFGSSWNKRESKRPVLVLPHLADRSDSVLHHSDSIGSGRSTPKSRRFTDTSKRSNHSDDLVEMDFTPMFVGRSPSGSFGSSDSLHRPRTNSGYVGGSLIGKNGWVPTVDQISEVTSDSGSGCYQTPSSMVIQQSLQNSRNAVDAECYIAMGGEEDSLKRGYQGNSTGRISEKKLPGQSGEDPTSDYIPMDLPASSSKQQQQQQSDNSEYLAMDFNNSATNSGNTCKNTASSTDSTNQATTTGTVVTSRPVSTSLAYSSLSKRCSDEELFRRLARVEMTGEQSTSKTAQSSSNSDYTVMTPPTTATATAPFVYNRTQSPSSVINDPKKDPNVINGRSCHNSAENLRAESGTASVESSRRQKSASPSRSPILKRMFNAFAKSTAAASSPAMTSSSNIQTIDKKGPDSPKGAWSSMAHLPPGRSTNPTSAAAVPIATAKIFTPAAEETVAAAVSLPSERELKRVGDEILEYTTLDASKSPIFTRCPNNNDQKLSTGGASSPKRSVSESERSANVSANIEKPPPAIVYAQIDPARSWSGVNKKC